MGKKFLETNRSGKQRWRAVLFSNTVCKSEGQKAATQIEGKQKTDLGTFEALAFVGKSWPFLRRKRAESLLGDSAVLNHVYLCMREQT